MTPTTTKMIVLLAARIGAMSFLPSARGQSLPAEVWNEVKLSSTTCAALSALNDGDGLGYSIASIGDLDGNGIRELAVGAADDGALNEGAVWILFMCPNGTVSKAVRIANGSAGFAGSLDQNDAFGVGVAPLGDLDLDGTPDLLVGAPGDDDTATTGSDRGAVWILFLSPDGSVKPTSLKLSAAAPWIDVLLPPGAAFGTGLANLGDLDGDGHVELLIGAPRDDDGGTDRGSVWLFSLDEHGSVVQYHKISSTQGGLPNNALSDQGLFGSTGTLVGDLDEDGLMTIAIGAPVAGEVWMLELDAAATVVSHSKLTGGGSFGGALASIEDLNGDGIRELLAGVALGGDGAGYMRCLFLSSAGLAVGEQVIGQGQGDFVGPIFPGDHFCYSIAVIGDIDADGRPEVAAGAIGDDDGGLDRGAAWILSLRATQWSNLESGTPGSAGVPELTGKGSLVAGSPVTLTLTRAKSFALAWLVIGASILDAPFKGGTLIPVPTLVLLFTTDGSGKLVISGVMPSGVPSRSTFYFQYWILDPLGPAGFAASNGLAGTTP